MPKEVKRRIAILGAGPIGLEAALYARKLDLAVTVYERGRFGEHLQRWGHVRLFSPFAMNSTALGRAAIRADKADHNFPADGDHITGRQHVAQYIEPLARSTLLKDCIRTENQILSIGKSGLLKGDAVGKGRRAESPFRLLVREKQKEHVDEADIVLDCTGTYAQHRWLGEGGIPAPGELAIENHIAYGLDDILGDRRNHYAGKYTLVVGGGYSAATSVCYLSELAEKHADTWVIWLARSPGSQPIKRIMNDPLRERDRLAVRANTLATRIDGNVEYHPNSTVRAIEPIAPDKGYRVHALIGKTAKTFDVDRIIGNVGYSPDSNLYRELQVHECYASLGPMKLAAALLGSEGGDCLYQVSHGPESLRNPEPNFYILGSKSYGRNSHFLLRLGFEQIRDVFTLITGDPKLDLYS